MKQRCCAGSPVASLQSAEGLQGSACLKLHCLLLPLFLFSPQGWQEGFSFFFFCSHLAAGHHFAVPDPSVPEVVLRGQAVLGATGTRRHLSSQGSMADTQAPATSKNPLRIFPQSTG